MGSSRIFEAHWGTLALCSALATLLLAPALAHADQVVCEEGAGAGQCTSPSAIDVDRAEGLLYVVDDGNGEIDVYDAGSGEQIGPSWEVGFSISSLAVDNDEASPAFGDVYLFDTACNCVRRFHPDGEEVLPSIGAGLFDSQAKVDIGPGGVVYVADNIGGGDRRVQTFDHEGNPLQTCAALEPGGFGENLQGFAVDSAGGFYLASAGGRPIERYDSSCNRLEEGFHTSFNIQALAVDAGDYLYVSDVTPPGGEIATYLYDAAGTLLKVLYGNGTQVGTAISLAPLSNAGGDLFLAESTSSGGLGRVVQVALPPPGPVVHPDSGLSEAKPVSSTWATLNSWVNPEGKASGFRFEYVDDAAYQKDIGEGGDGFAEAVSSASAAVPTPGSVPQFLADFPLFALAPVSAKIGCTGPQDPSQADCLKPETVYRFRAVASNTDSAPEERFGPVGEFETSPPLQIHATWSSEVGIDAAKLSAEFTAFGASLTGRFQYVEEAICLQDVKAAEEAGAEDPAERCFDRAQETADLDFGSAEGRATRTAQLGSLKQGTAYRYRVLLENIFTEETGETQAFTTYVPPNSDPCPNEAVRGNGGTKLPDCRAYEMVSPLDKGGGDIAVQPTVPGYPAELNQSADKVPALGPGLTYSSDRAFADAISAPYTSQYIASRVPGDGNGEWEEGEGWQSHGISPPRKGASFYGAATLVLETNYMAFSQDLGQAWLRADSQPELTEDAIVDYPNLYRRENATDSYVAICPVKPPVTSPPNYTPLPQGFSADGQRTVFRVNEKLTPKAANTTALQLYACEEGTTEPVVVSVLPPARGGVANTAGSTAGTSGKDEKHREHSLHNAVSADGERIYWTDAADAPGRIYLRERPFAEGTECAGPAAPCTRAVSEAVGGAGSDAAAHFWTAANDGSAAIFSFTAGPLTGNLYRFDAEPGTTQPIAAGVEGVAGYSEDAQRVYFVSTQVLAPGAVTGQRNLYLHEVGAGTRLVAAAVEGSGTTTGFCSLDPRLPVLLNVRRCTRATPDGSQLAFMSRAPLTGYDNADAASGKAAAEVFLYDIEAGGAAGELLCVSCNPSGARPQSREVGGSSGSQTPTAARLAGWQDAFHAPRALSSDGRRLFFESYDALLPADTNGALDVYQWERAGKGGCETTDANHFPQNGGCLDLISSGEDRHDSQFLDASADGDDVFFKTAESLYGPDPGQIDIYDVRVLGGFPAPDPPQPSCEGEACQSPPAPPRQPAPSSSLFDGPDNLPTGKS